jgi:hypothetical protein
MEQIRRGFGGIMDENCNDRIPGLWQQKRIGILSGKRKCSGRSTEAY